MANSLGIRGEVKKYAVNLGQFFGEWAEPADVYHNDWKNVVTPHPEVSTAYTSYVLGCMAEIAEEMGYSKDLGLSYHATRQLRLFYLIVAAAGRYRLILPGGIFITEVNGSAVYISRKELRE